MIPPIFDMFWPKPIVALSALLGFFIAFKDLFDTSKSYMPAFCWIVAVLCLIIFIYLCFDIYKNIYIPKSKKKKMGFLVLVNAESQSIYKDTISKLITIFNDTLKNKKSLDYDVIQIPYHASERIRSYNDDKVLRLLMKKRCRLIIKVKVLCDDCINASNYETDISATIVHKAYNKQIQKIVQREFQEVSKVLLHMEYEKEEKMKVLRMKAYQLSYMCTYIIGIVLCLDGYINEGARVFDELNSTIKSVPRDTFITEHMATLLPLWGFSAHMDIATNHLNAYFKSREIHNLDNMASQLEIANQYQPDTYDYYLNMAFYHVVKYRNIDEAQKCIDTCKGNPKNDHWRYSDAFLCAYKNERAIKIYKKYSTAFSKSDYNRIDITIFIEQAIERDNEIAGLYLALALLYFESEDATLAIANFRKYLSLISPNAPQQELIQAIKTRYKLNLLEITMSNTIFPNNLSMKTS